jgi:hypothetical protein
MRALLAQRCGLSSLRLLTLRFVPSFPCLFILPTATVCVGAYVGYRVTQKTPCHYRKAITTFQ